MKIKLHPLEACDKAAEFIKRAGFNLVWVSMQSTSCYYKFPNRHGVLRIATHRKGGRNEWSIDGPTIVSITFPEGSIKKDGYLHLSNEYIENYSANAIGLYLIRSKFK